MILLILLSLLDHPRHNVRIGIQRTFPVCSVTVPLLEWAEKCNPTLESRHRAKLLVDRYYQDGVDCIIARLGKLPWLSGEPFHAKWVRQGNEATSHLPFKDYVNYREATRCWLRYQIISRLPWQAALREMVVNELWWNLRYEKPTCLIRLR